MRVDQETEERLLAQVRAASEHSRSETARARAIMAAGAAARAQSIQAAIEAGIPRQKIADAAGVHRNLLYRLTKDIQE